MNPRSTLFLDVGSQRDLWPGGAWPLLDAAASERVRALCALGRTLDVRTGGIQCVHDRRLPSLPAHCLTGSPGAERVAACAPRGPVRLYVPDADERPADRGHAIYLGSGCDAAIPPTSSLGRAFAFLIAGVRDAVVFGAGIEFGVAHLVAALLEARVRTHLVLDATGTADAAHAQALLERWKRRGVDVLTAGTAERLLRRSRDDAN